MSGDAYVEKGRSRERTASRGTGSNDNIRFPTTLSKDPLARPREDLVVVSLELGNGGRFRTDPASDGDQDGALCAVVQDRLAVPVDESEIVVLGEGHDGGRVDVERLLERGRKVDASEIKETVRFTVR